MYDLISRKALWEYVLNQKGKSIDANDIMRFPAAMPDYDRLHPKVDKNFSSCLDCIHSEDTECMCKARNCVHVIAELRECYVDKRKRRVRNGSYYKS